MRKYCFEAAGYIFVLILLCAFGFSPESSMKTFWGFVAIFMFCAIGTVYGLCLVPHLFSRLWIAVENWPQTLAAVAAPSVIIGACLIYLGETRDAIMWGWTAVIIGGALGLSAIGGYTSRRSG